MIIPFHKYHGAGNDFIMIDNRPVNWFPETKDVLALCDRRFGIGADGLILLNDADDADFSMRYFNCDGRESTMCGNGGRCITAFALSLGIIKKKAVFSAVDGMHESYIEEIDETNVIVRLRMKDVEIPHDHRQDEIFLNTGSPHLVKITEDPDNVDLIAEARKIRYGDRFVDEGTNVDFVKVDGDRLYVRTYERGVEDETLSCGTGVTASALAAAIFYPSEKDHYSIETKGGKLKVSFRKEKEKFTDVWLEGPAAFVFEGTFKI